MSPRQPKAAPSFRRRKTLNTRGQLQLLALLKRCDEGLAEFADAENGICRLLGVRLDDQYGRDWVLDLAGRNTTIATLCEVLDIRMVESKRLTKSRRSPASRNSSADVGRRGAK